MNDCYVKIIVPLPQSHRHSINNSPTDKLRFKSPTTQKNTKSPLTLVQKAQNIITMAAGSISRPPPPPTSRRSHRRVLLRTYAPTGRCLPGAIAPLCHVFWRSFSPGDGSPPPPEQGCSQLAGAPPSLPYLSTMVWESKCCQGKVSGALVFSFLLASPQQKLCGLQRLL